MAINSAPGGDSNMAKKKSVLIPLLIIFIMIAGLSFVTYWRFKDFQKSFEEINLPEFKMPEISSDFWFGGEQEPKEFTTPDNKLKIKYRSYWVEMGEESLKSYFSGITETEKAKTLLFAMRFNIKNPVLAFLVVQELNLERNLEKAVQAMAESVKEKGGEMKIFNLNIEGGQADVEAEYQSKDQGVFYSKERLILTEGGFYAVSVFSQKGNWGQIEAEAEEIFGSIELL